MKKYEFRFNKRALLSIILIICMVFGSMPVAASEIDSEGASVAVSGSDLPAESTETKPENKAEKTASPTDEPTNEPTIIDSVSIYELEKPAAGNNPDFRVTVSAGEDYTIDFSYGLGGVVWTDMSDGKELSSNDTFEAGKRYRVDIYVKAYDEAAFKTSNGQPAADADIDGRIASVKALPTVSADKLIIVSGTYSIADPNTTISDVEATDLDMPVFGAKPDFDATVPANANYTVDSIKWTKDVSTESEYLTKELTANDTFDAGDYAVTVTFRAKDGYKFRANADGVITGRLNGDVAMPMSSITNDGEYDTYSICLMPSVEEPEEETEYEMLEGMNGKWIREKGKKLRFRANGDFKKFVRVLVDGVEIDRRHYVASSGSTVIELNESYLDELANGKHLLTVEFTDGEVSTNFYINETAGDSEVPKTGDNDYAGVCAALMFISFCSMIALAVYDIRRRKEEI